MILEICRNECMNENLIDVNKKLFLYLYRGRRRERGVSEKLKLLPWR